MSAGRRRPAYQSQQQHPFVMRGGVSSRSRRPVRRRNLDASRFASRRIFDLSLRGVASQIASA
jgi:hypothetical protein